MFAPEDGAVDAPALARALHADAKRHGARTLNTRVTRLSTILGQATGVEIPAGKIKAEHVVIAAGAWSPRIDHLPRTLPVEPVRGQMAAAPWPANMPRTVLYYDHGYVLARSGEAIFGSTMEHVGFDGSVTESGVRGIGDGEVKRSISCDLRFTGEFTHAGVPRQPGRQSGHSA